MLQREVVSLLAVTLLAPALANAQAAVRTVNDRDPLPMYWSDWANVPITDPTGGRFTQCTGVFEAWIARVNWSGPVDMSNCKIYWPPDPLYFLQQTATMIDMRIDPYRSPENRGMITAFHGSECPAGYWMVNYDQRRPAPDAWGNANMAYVSFGANQFCQAAAAPYDFDHRRSEPTFCEFCGELGLGTGSLHTSIDLGIELAGIPLTLSYDTRMQVPTADAGVLSPIPPPSAGAPSFGNWVSSHHKTMIKQGSAGHFIADRGNGYTIDLNAGVPDSDTDERLAILSYTTRLSDFKRSAFETYDYFSGKLSSISYANGSTLTYSYSTTSTPATIAPSAGLLIGVQDQFGRAIQFLYEQPAGLSPRIKSVIDPAGWATTFGYDAAGKLTQVNWPDGTTRRLLYELAAFPWALTGVVDESGNRFATYGYDVEGRAVSRERAGGVAKLIASYTTPPVALFAETYDRTNGRIVRRHEWLAPRGTILTLPEGATVSVGTSTINGKVYLTSQSQPADRGVLPGIKARAYDANGNSIQEDDFNGRRTCRAFDLSRNTEVVRVEGLSTSIDCSTVLAAGATLPAGSRKISTAWHPKWKLNTRVFEPKKRTTYVYSGQVDPITNTVTYCPTTGASIAYMVDGTTPYALLCKKIEQVTTDVDGSKGSSAVVDTTVPPRVWSYWYNTAGQLAAAQSPRTSANNYYNWVTYYVDTVFTGTDPNAVGHRVGDIQTTKNELNQVTTYTKYNKQGDVLEKVDPNGVVTSMTYDARRRLTSMTVDGRTTTYRYWPTGKLKQVVFPGGTQTVQYTYDAAQRLTVVTDNLGNSITSVLDKRGNRLSTLARDPSGVLQGQIDRTFDALGRLEKLTGRESP